VIPPDLEQQRAECKRALHAALDRHRALMVEYYDAFAVMVDADDRAAADAAGERADAAGDKMILLADSIDRLGARLYRLLKRAATQWTDPDALAEDEPQAQL
jgi:hypothetical protein